MKRVALELGGNAPFIVFKVTLTSLDGLGQDLNSSHYIIISRAVST